MRRDTASVTASSATPAQRVFTAAVLLVALGGCSAQPTIRVASDRGPPVNWSAYSTYAWRSAPQAASRGPRDPRELLEWRIRSEVERQLAVKGFVLTPEGRPDFLVSYRIDEKEKTTDSIGDYIRYRQNGGKEGPSEAYVFGYEEGLLILEFFDAQTQQLLWRASASAIVTSDQSDTKVREAIQAMLQRFPPQ